MTTSQPQQSNMAEYEFTFASKSKAAIFNISFQDGAQVITLPNVVFVQFNCDQAQFYTLPPGVSNNLAITPNSIMVSGLTGTMSLTLFFNIPGTALTGWLGELSGLDGVTLTIENVATGKKQILNNEGNFSVPVS